MEERIKTMLPLLNEKQRKIFLASEAISYGWGGLSKVSKISGVSIPTIRLGIKRSILVQQMHLANTQFWRRTEKCASQVS